MTEFDMSGKVAMVTGASSGFGVHFAKILAQRGAKVVALLLCINEEYKISPASRRTSNSSSLSTCTLHPRQLGGWNY